MENMELRNIDLTAVQASDLVDIRDIKINSYLKPDQKKAEYVKQIKNPYCYKYGDYIVKISFEDTNVTLTERLKELISKTVESAGTA